MLPSNLTFSKALQQKGINRRRFIKFCTAMTAILALPPRYVAQVAAALEKARKPVLVWLEFQDCAGNTEAMLRSTHPTVEEVVLETLSWEYHETIMAGYGKHAEAALRRVVEEEKGKYPGRGRRLDSGRRRWRLLHDRRTHGARHRSRSLRQRGGLHRGREPAPGTAACRGRIPIPPARWGCTKRCPELPS